MNVTEKNKQNSFEKKSIKPKTIRSNSFGGRIQDITDFSSGIQEKIEKKQGASLVQFLRAELTRDYQLENDEERFSERREKIYSFMKIPREVEKFMLYGFLQCADSFLFVYTFLPLRFLMALWKVIVTPVRRYFRRTSKDRNSRQKVPALSSLFDKLSTKTIEPFNFELTSLKDTYQCHKNNITECSFDECVYSAARSTWHLGSRPVLAEHDSNRLTAGKRCLRPAEVCDLLKGILLLGCWAITWKVDTSMMYHLVKSQSIIKLYIFYNMLEVGDRLFSAFGQDTIDALLWTATEPKSKIQARSQQLGTLPHLLFALVYILLHSILVLFQVTTLNVAINSNNKALLTIMMSNNFVELKGSVFKKFDKNSLFQLSGADVRERFHLTMLLLAVSLQTMKEYAWRADRLTVLLPDCILLLLAEVLVDWVKHAFITRFNELNATVYRDYTMGLAYDVAQTRQETAVSDPSDLVARRMSFIPLPLGVAMGRVLCTTVMPSAKPPNLILLLLAYLILMALRTLINLIILGMTCDFISSHSKEVNSAKVSSNHPSQGTPKKSSSRTNLMSAT